MTRSPWRLTRSVLHSKPTLSCSACQCARSSATRDIAVRSLPLTFNVDPASLQHDSVGHRRYYTSSRAYGAAAVDEASKLDASGHNIAIVSKSSSQDLSRGSVSKSQIRSSLRAWGAQNEALMKQNAPDVIEAQGRIRRLPNALFAARSSQDEEPAANSRTSTESMFGEDVSPISSIIQPGTLLWFQGLGISGQYAVYIGNIGVQSLLALESGSWAVDSIGSLRKDGFDHRRLRVPDFLEPQHIERLKEHMPKSNVGRPIDGSEAVSEISMKGLMPPELIDDFLAAMHDFRHTVNDHMRQFAEQFEEGYARVALEHDYRAMNMVEFLAEGFNIDWDAIASTEKMAITQHLADQDAVTTYQTAEDLSVLVMPTTMRKGFEQVVEWARQYQDTASKAALGRDVTLLLSENPLTAFIDKARRLVLKSRKSRSPTVRGGLGPCSSSNVDGVSDLEKNFTGVEFTKTDLLFIDFIWTMAFRVPSVTLCGSLKIMPVTSLILRAIGAYPDLLLNATIARLFLKEIGCADPWIPRSNDLAMAIPNGKASQRTDELYRESQAYVKYIQGMIDNARLVEMDSMAHIRRKWTMPAFAIDPSKSNIREDALSIEPATELEGAHWIHIHVSHITAWFEPDSIVGRLAKHHGGSTLTIDRSVASYMLPSMLTGHFSLQQGSPVLTISTLVASDGTSVDVKMSAGSLENFVPISREAVYDMLGTKSNLSDERSVLLVGKVSRPPPTVIDARDREIVLKHKADLENLDRVLQRRRQKRVEEIPENVSIPYYNFESEIETSHRAEFDSKREHKPYHWVGDPGIVISAQHHIRRETDMRRSSEMVTQAMRLAAESTGRWLAERQIPAIFVGTETVSDNSYDQIASKKSYERFFKPLFMRGSNPIPYWSLHLKSFCNCTSPLRRYIDLLAVWQIDAYLKAEATGSIQPGEPVRDDSILSLTKKQIDEYLRFDAHVMDTADHIVRSVKETYTFQALFRAFHFKEAPLPAQWEVLVHTPMKLTAGLEELNANGYLIPFGSLCEILPDPAGWAKMAQPGQFLPVTITAVDPDKLVVQCTATGCPQNQQTMLQHIHCINEKPIHTEPTISPNLEIGSSTKSTPT